jgi:ABC-type lipoprotein export system ATPase subunit
VPQPLIELESVSRTYAVGDVRIEALRTVSLEIRSGEMVAIMGPSGSGKSTLLYVLGCLDSPSAGRYLLDGQDVAYLGSDDLAEVRNREIGFVFQSFQLLPRLTALENVELPLYYGDLEFAAQRSRAQAVLAALGLGERAGHLPSQLSGGQQQRVAIARALVGRPRLLLADEPTGNLDSATSIEILEVFRRLHREEGLTVVLVTHEPDVAAWADRIVSMRDGRIVSDRPSVGEAAGR